MPPSSKDRKVHHSRIIVSAQWNHAAPRRGNAGPLSTPPIRNRKKSKRRRRARPRPGILRGRGLLRQGIRAGRQNGRRPRSETRRLCRSRPSARQRPTLARGQSHGPGSLLCDLRQYDQRDSEPGQAHGLRRKQRYMREALNKGKQNEEDRAGHRCDTHVRKHSPRSKTSEASLRATNRSLCAVL